MSPAGEAKVFCRTVQDSVNFLSSIYIGCISLLVILPRLKCTQEETRYVAGPLPLIRYPLIFIYPWYRTDRSRAASKGLAGTSRSQVLKMRPVRRQGEVVPVRAHNSRGCTVTEGGEGERPAIEAANAGAKKSQFMGGSSPKEYMEMQRRRFSGFFPLVFKNVIKRSEKVTVLHGGYIQ
jgi:hypothetical protein